MLCHVVCVFRTLEVGLPHIMLHYFLILCSGLVKEALEVSLESNYATIGRSLIKEIERTANISAPRDDTPANPTIYNDIPSVLERHIDDFERAATIIQEARNPTGVPIAGSTLELWNGMDDDNDDNDDSAVLRATVTHAFAVRQLATAKDAKDKEAAAQVQDEDTEMGT